MKRFEMTPEQRDRLMRACAPVPYLVMGGVEPRSPQESANAVWQSLGDELGFVWDTARPIQGQPDTVFEAEPKPEGDGA